MPTFQAMADTEAGESPRRRADAGRRGHAALCAQLGARAELDAEPGDEQEHGESPLVAQTAAQWAAWQTASLEALDLGGLIIVGVHIGEHCLVVALGIAADGQKHALDLWDGSTDNARVYRPLLANLQSRGLHTDRSLLVPRRLEGPADGGPRQVREAALVPRCQRHKARNTRPLRDLRSSSSV